ncbi:Lysoplasmalogenase [Blyttiomyces sp. JEL0837]|nr:Lysoplasmalogenase [Blyttiomyces sp. JEL0837]
MTTSSSLSIPLFVGLTVPHFTLATINPSSSSSSSSASSSSAAAAAADVNNNNNNTNNKPFLKLIRVLFKCAPILYLAHTLKSSNTDNNNNPLIHRGLLLSSLGDAFLSLDKDKLFIPGLLSFLFAHVEYIRGINSLSSSSGSSSTISHPLLGLGIISSGGVLLHTIILRNMKKRKLVPAVVAYASTILVMLWRAAARYIESGGNNNDVSSTWGLIGAGLFVVSDFSLAYDKFVQSVPHPWRDYLVMGTYYSAQLFITLGAM